MSKSLKRVARALEEIGLRTEIVEVGAARTASEAAASLGCAVDQIANSIILVGQRTGQVKLFLTSGAHRVDLARAAAAAGEPLGKADAGVIRAQTGFAIGGVSPVGHTAPLPAWIDPHLLCFGRVYVAAGTPRHLFGLTPAELVEITGGQVIDVTETSKAM
ncbi:MAG: YbaK/EbsC family protein [Pseudomonadota bacterium]